MIHLWKYGSQIGESCDNWCGHVTPTEPWRSKQQASLTLMCYYHTNDLKTYKYQLLSAWKVMSGDINPECGDNGSGVQVGFNSSSTLHCLALGGRHFHKDKFELCKGLNWKLEMHSLAWTMHYALPGQDGGGPAPSTPFWAFWPWGGCVGPSAKALCLPVRKQICSPTLRSPVWSNLHWLLPLVLSH